MSLPKYERTDTITSTKIFYSGSIATYPVSANFSLYDPDGVAFITDASGIRTGTTGEFKYHFSTNSAHDLGVYITQWDGRIYMGDKWGYLNKTYRDEFQLVYVD